MEIVFILAIIGTLGYVAFNLIGKAAKKIEQRYEELMPDRMVDLSGFVDLPKVER